MKFSKHFEIEEVVPPNIFNQFGGRASQFIDHRAALLLDTIREMIDQPITINDWKNGNQFTNSGFRMPDSLVGGFLSQHKFGRAFDLKIGLDGDINSYEGFRNFIRKNYTELNKLGLTTIEIATPTWLHIDMRYTGLNYLYEVPYR